MGKHSRYIFKLLFFSLLFLNAGAQDTSLFPPPVEELTDTIFEQATPRPNEEYQFKNAGTEQVKTRKVSEGELNEIKSEDAYWYVNEVPPREKRASPTPNQKGKKAGKQNDGAFLNVPWLRVLFWILLSAVFITLLVWILRNSNIRLFGAREPQAESKPEEDLSTNIFEMNFEQEIQKATEAKNYRLAVRLMYLRTLRDLANHGLIHYTHEKTNADYLFQLAGTPFYKNFFRLTRDFDYTWYGHFELSQDGFALVQSDFLSFKQQLS